MNFDQAVDKATPILKNQMGGTCSFGFIGDNHHAAFHAQVCHYELKKVSPKTEYYYSTVTPKLNAVLFEDIYDFTVWCLGDDGPYRDIVKGRDRTVIVQDGAVAGIVLQVQLNDEAALLRNMSMALRLTGEYESNFRAYLKFKAEGLSNCDSFYLGNLYTDRFDTAIPSSPCNSNHSIVPDALDFNLIRFEQGRPYKLGESLDGTKINQKAIDQWDHHAARTTGCFRDTDKPVVRLNTINQSMNIKKSYVQGRWHKTEMGVNFGDVSKYWMDEYKPKFIKTIEKRTAA